MREHQRAAKAFLERVGATRIVISHHGKHAKLSFHWRGREERLSLAVSPSDRRNTVQTIARLKRLTTQ